MPIEKESWYIYAKDKGISKAKAQEYWNTAKESVDKKQSDFSESDWQKVFGIFKKIISNATKKESYLEQDNKDDEKEKKKLKPFIGYAKNEGIEEDQAKAIFYSVRGALGKKEDQDVNDLGPEQMAELWKNYKEAIKDALNKKKKESIILQKKYIIDGYCLNEQSNIFYWHGDTL